MNDKNFLESGDKNKTYLLRYLDIFVLVQIKIIGRQAGGIYARN